MFTGIIEEVGVVESVREMDRARELGIRAPGMAGELEPGDSIAVDGACLTAVTVSRDGFTTQAIGTTLSRTVAAGYKVGSKVNLERALRVGEGLDGHFVQGHVDGLGTLVSVEPSGDYRLMDFEIPPEVADFTILHGSITVNGVSLTVNDLPAPGRCQVGIIPYTWKHTNFHAMKPGDEVNLEGDLIGKYVGKLLSARGKEGQGPDGSGSSVNLGQLEEMGY